MSNILHSTPIRSSAFHYNKQTKTLTAEMSDLGTGRKWYRVYDDACDAGITIISDHTGREVVFVITYTATDRDGDTLHWLLKPAKKYQGVDEELQVIIFND